MRSIALLVLLLSACGPGAPTYAECVRAADCGEADDTCFRLLFDRTDGSVGEGNLCSRECRADADCPEAGVCIALEGDPEARFFCAARCAEAADCYASFTCTSIAAMDLSLCLPP